MKKMKIFAYNVLGWINPQIVRASSIEVARTKLEDFSFSPDIYGLREISEEEREEILDALLDC